jgi:paraquat-inducible protein B
MESFVTGQLVIELDFRPESPAQFFAEPGGIAEIPSVPSNIQQVLERMQSFVTELQATVDVDELVSGVMNTLAAVEALARSEDLHGALAALNRLSNLEALENIPAGVLETLAELDRTLAEVRALVTTTDQRMAPLVARAEDGLDSLSGLLREAGSLLESLSAEVSADSELNFQMRRTLEESEAAARSLRQLAEFLERHPEALLRGRREPRE